VDELKSLLQKFSETVAQGRGSLAEAAQAAPKLVELCKSLGQYQILSSIYSSLAELYRNEGDSSSAAAMFQESCAACRTGLEEATVEQSRTLREQLRASLGNQADLIRDTGHLQTALPLYEEMGQVARSLGEVHWLQASLNNQGFIHMNEGRLNEAMEAYKEQERFCQELGNVDDLIQSLFCQVLIHEARREVENGVAVCDHIVKICRKERKIAATFEVRKLRKRLQKIQL